MGDVHSHSQSSNSHMTDSNGAAGRGVKSELNLPTKEEILPVMCYNTDKLHRTVM